MAILCDMHSLMPVGFFMFLSMNDLFTRMFICCWSECVMSVLGTQNIPRAISVLILGSQVVLYC